MNIGFERIAPVPQYPRGTTQAALSSYLWESKAQIVTNFKIGLKASLRECQYGRCCFCRRLLYDDYATHLEHFVDKADYSQYRFEIRNLALSCGTCNVKKNGYFSKWTARYKKIRKNPTATEIPVLSIKLNAGSPFPSTAADFRWVNPYVHNYSDHIILSHGWIFQGRTVTGRRTIRGLRLNELTEVERRALTERLNTRGGKLSMLVAALSELDQHRARDVARAISSVIARRRKTQT